MGGSGLSAGGRTDQEAKIVTRGRSPIGYKFYLSLFHVVYLQSKRVVCCTKCHILPGSTPCVHDLVGKQTLIDILHAGGSEGCSLGVTDEV